MKRCKSFAVGSLAVLVGLLALSATAQESPDWRDTLERISSGVVSIRVDGTRAFDTEWNISSQATGFVVDAERGLIMTNRHVVMPGPVMAEAIFRNREEVELKPIYRDPVHDFGFFRYDPEALSFIEPEELKLAPEEAQVGREIQVIGNDAGEQLSFLAGTIARLDRHAPEYGRGKYNDFNTFYLQAASGTSGGSSGSPVIDIEGRVVALNAGANVNAASSFFLPLDRVQRALRLIQAGEPVPRGTLQTVFLYRPYDELRRLGLSRATEELVRESYPHQTGMLVVDQVLPGSSASGDLEVGDILVRINGELVTEFVTLETILDDAVGESITIEVERGGDQFRQEVSVGDLDAITPDEFLQFGDAIVHTLSYQQARHFNMPVAGVYVANPGYVFSAAAIPRGTVILTVNGKRTLNIDDMEATLAELADGEKATVRFFTFEDSQTSKLRVFYMDRRWFPALRCRRDDELGVWPCQPLADNSVARPPTPGATEFASNGDPRAEKLAPSLVMVNFDLPYTVSGVSERHYHGTGKIVDVERGLVVVDRNTVPVAIGDVRLTFAGSLDVPGKVEYIHPLHNLAMVSYDPELIGDTPVKAIKLSDRTVKPGEKVWVVGLKSDHQLASQAAEVASIEAVNFPPSRTLRFTDNNLETLTLVNGPSDFDGVVIDKKGAVVSFWSSFAYQGGRELLQVNKGVPVGLVKEMLALVRDNKPLHSLEAEFALIPLSSARNLGLPDEWIRKLERHNPSRRQVLQVSRLVAGSPAEKRLRSGDVLLAIDGEPVNRFREVELAVQKPQVDVTVWREDRELNYSLQTVELDGHDIDRVTMWAGALLQMPHREMATQRGIKPYGVYVAYFGYGSPATRYGLWAGRRIIEVDGQPTPDLDALLSVVSGKSDREALRLKTVTWNNSTEVITLKLDEHYWPAYELRLTESGWQRFDLE